MADLATNTQEAAVVSTVGGLIVNVSPTTVSTGSPTGIGPILDLQVDPALLTIDGGSE